MEKSSAKISVQTLTRFSLLAALEAVVCFVPFLGSIPIPGTPIVATLAHIPIIVTALLMGTLPGALMGGLAGTFSFIIWSFFPPPTSIAFAFVFTPLYPPGNFWSLVICFVPRILVGVVAGSVHQLMKNHSRRGILAYGLAGLLGSLTNTFLVLGGAYSFFGQEYASTLAVEFNLLLGALGLMVLFNGVPEAILGALVGQFVCRPLHKALEKQSR